MSKSPWMNYEHEQLSDSTKKGFEDETLMGSGGPKIKKEPTKDIEPVITTDDKERAAVLAENRELVESISRKRARGRAESFFEKGAYGDALISAQNAKLPILEILPYAYLHIFSQFEKLAKCKDHTLEDGTVVGYSCLTRLQDFHADVLALIAKYNLDKDLIFQVMEKSTKTGISPILVYKMMLED